MCVLVCETCEYVIADPNHQLSAFYNCVKCGESHMGYKEATAIENLKIKLHLIDSSYK